MGLARAANRHPDQPPPGALVAHDRDRLVPNVATVSRSLVALLSVYQYNFNPNWTSRAARVAMSCPNRSPATLQAVFENVQELSRPFATGSASHWR